MLPVDADSYEKENLIDHRPPSKPGDQAARDLIGRAERPMKSYESIGSSYGLSGLFRDDTIGFGKFKSVQRSGPLVSTTYTLMNFVRAEVSAGCLSLPIAFESAGMYLGLLISPLFGIVNAIYGNVLISCSQRMCEKTGLPSLDYGHLAKKAVDYGPERFRRHSKKALYLTNLFVIAYTIGVAAVQALFQATTLRKFLMFNQVSYIPSDSMMLLFFMPVFLAVVQIHRLDILGYIATAGNVLLIASVIIILQYILRPPNQINTEPPVGSFMGVMLFAGSMMYTYEGQAMLLPLENRMKHPKDMLGWTGVVTVGTVVLGIFFTSMGFFGYAKFGASTEQTLTLNMPDTWLYQIVNLLMLGAVFAGWPLQIYVVTEMLWSPVRRKYLYRVVRYERVLVVLYRCIVVLVVLALCWAVPQVGYLVSLIGVSVGSIIALVLPPALALLVFWEDWTPKQRTIYSVIHGITITVGLVLFVVGSYAQITNIVSLQSTGRPVVS